LLWQKSFSILSVSAWHALARKKKAPTVNVILNATAEAGITMIASAANPNAIASQVPSNLSFGFDPRETNPKLTLKIPP